MFGVSGTACRWQWLLLPVLTTRSGEPLAIGGGLEGDRAHHCDIEKSVSPPSVQLRRTEIVTSHLEISRRHDQVRRPG